MKTCCETGKLVENMTAVERLGRHHDHCLGPKELEKKMQTETIYYRWVVINNQETCYTCVEELVDGYFSNAEDVMSSLEDKYYFKEYCYRVKKLDFTETPEWMGLHK